MKKSDWFTRLEYKDFDILLQKNTVADTGLTKSYDQELLEWMNRYNLNETMARLLKTDIPSEPCTEIAIESQDHNMEQIIVSTGCIPEVEEISYEELVPVTGLLKDALLEHGIIAIRFFNNKIQYVIDLETFYIKLKEEE